MNIISCRKFIQRINMKAEYKMKVWYLILFNLFFSFAGSFVALYSGAEELGNNIIRIGFSILFIIFLLIVVFNAKDFIRNKIRSWFEMFFSGFLSGIVLWYTMVLFVPLTRLTLDSCSLNICEDVLRNYYLQNNIANFSILDNSLIASMIISFVIIGPLKEELLYRVAMMTILIKRYSLLSSSIIVAMIFAAFHLRYFIFMASLSLVLSALVLRYGNIFPAVIAHGTYNTMIYFLYPSKTIIGNYTNLGIFEILLAITLLLSLYYYSCNVISRSSLEWLKDK